MTSHLNVLVVVISIVTIISGLTQVIVPALVLGFIGAEVTPASAHFFAIVGMFMFLFGGMMLHTVYSAYPNHVAIWWAAFQKLGAFLAVSIGVIHHIFAPIALAVALFDLFSGLLFLYYLKNLRRHEVR